MDAKELIARRIALELKDGDLVNVGIGFSSSATALCSAAVGAKTAYIEPGSLGKTATARASTASCAMNCRTARSSSAWPRPRS